MTTVERFWIKEKWTRRIKKTLTCILKSYQWAYMMWKEHKNPKMKKSFLKRLLDKLPLVAIARFKKYMLRWTKKIGFRELTALFTLEVHFHLKVHLAQCWMECEKFQFSQTDYCFSNPPNPLPICGIDSFWLLTFCICGWKNTALAIACYNHSIIIIVNSFERWFDLNLIVVFSIKSGDTFERIYSTHHEYNNWSKLCIETVWLFKFVCKQLSV